MKFCFAFCSSTHDLLIQEVWASRWFGVSCLRNGTVETSAWPWEDVWEQIGRGDMSATIVMAYLRPAPCGPLDTQQWKKQLLTIMNSHQWSGYTLLLKTRCNLSWRRSQGWPGIRPLFAWPRTWIICDGQSRRFCLGWSALPFTVAELIMHIIIQLEKEYKRRWWETPSSLMLCVNMTGIFFSLKTDMHIHN